MLRRRYMSRFRFSVRTMLVATAVLSALLGLVGNEVQQLRFHRQAVRRVRELGGSCGSVVGNSFGESWGPKWCPLIKDSMYADFECVWLNSTGNAGLRDEDLAVLKHFPRLRVVEFSAPLLTDVAMTHLGEIDSLRELTLYETQVTGQGLRRLRGISLEMLVLGGPAVTDEMLKALDAFPLLRKLMITESSVTDKGLENLAHVPRLEKLYLSRSPLGDASMNHLSNLTRLQELDLIGLAISDDGIAPLAALTRLRSLTVVNTSVTAAGLTKLHGAPALKSLGFGPLPAPDTLMTLETALPGCQVSDASGYRCLSGW